jgi:hypothetical protein
VRTIYAFLLSGLTFTNYEEVCHILDVGTVSNPTFNKYAVEVNDVINNLLKEQLETNRDIIGNKNLTVAFDAGWSSRGWNVNECTVVMFDAESGLLMDLEHVLRKLPYDSQGQYEGASAGMEGYGLRKILERSVENKLNITAIVHDRDNCSLDIVTEFYPDVVEY